jgi:O-acetyl-ADP-ribose deacetylase (regulator of RNase III)
VVSPANSFGFMDGGIDWRYSERFGWQLMERLQQVIKGEDYFGELLVGQAIILETNDEMKKIPYLISAPTMRVPLDVSNSPNAYLAFKATLMEGDYVTFLIFSCSSFFFS